MTALDQLHAHADWVKAAPEAIQQLTAEAMQDIADYLRPAHLQQLRKIIDDPEASGNDRFVAWAC